MQPAFKTAAPSPRACRIQPAFAPRRPVPATSVPLPEPGKVQDFGRLAPREIEVLTWIAFGKSNTVIAEILGISIHTVDTLCRRAMRKFETSSRTTAAVRAAQMGLLPRV